MTLDRFKKVCEDNGLTVLFNQYGKYTITRAFFKNEIVASYDEKQIKCYTHPIVFCYANKTMMIDNGDGTEVYSASELEENIVKAVCKLKKLLIKIKKFEIEKEFE